jgi:hypothetical protein
MICSPMKRRSLILLLAMTIAAQSAVSFSGSNTRAARLFRLTAGASWERSANRTTGQARAAQLLAHLPRRFEANAGQIDAEVKYLARGPNYAIFLSRLRW